MTALTFDATYLDLPVAAVVANPDQPRKQFDQDAMDELATSIAENGLLQPIVVRPTGAVTAGDGTPTYMIIAGERRWRASKQAGVATIPCRVLAGLDDETSFVLSIMENVNRKDMTVSEEAKAFQQLVNTGRTPADVGKMFGKTPDYVTWRMQILGLSDRHLALVDRGAISTTVAYYASKLSGAGQQLLINKAARGEFRNDSEAVAYAQATEAQENQGFFFEVQELVEKQQTETDVDADTAAAASEFDALLQQLDQITARLAEIVPDGAKPREIAGQLGLNAETLCEYVNDLADRSVATRRVLRKAAAIVQVAQAKTAATVAA